MADNTTLNAGSGGDVFGADDISSVKYQRVKLIHGVDGTNDGDVATTNPFPVVATEADGTALIKQSGAAAADSGEMSMGLALSADPASVDTGDAVRPWHTLKGAQVVTKYPRELVVQATLILTTDTTETTLIAAGGAGVFHDLTKLVISLNHSADSQITIRDDTGQGIIFLLPFDFATGGPHNNRFEMTFDPPWKQTAANKNWTAQSSGSITSVWISAQAIKTSA